MHNGIKLALYKCQNAAHFTKIFCVTRHDKLPWIRLGYQAGLP